MVGLFLVVKVEKKMKFRFFYYLMLKKMAYGLCLGFFGLWKNGLQIWA